MIVRELINIIGFKVNQAQFRSAEKRVDALTSKMRTAGMRMTMFFTLPFVGFVAASARAQGIQLQALAQVEKGLESTAQVAGRSLEQLKKQARDLQEDTIFGDEEILQNISAQLLTFTNITQKEFDRTQQAVIDVSTRVFGLNANAETLRATSIQLGKALNDPTANLGALSRTGIQFTKQQKEVIKSLQASGKLAEAQSIILTELEKQYGGSAKAAAEASLGVKQLLNAGADFLEVWGAGIVPMLRRVTKWLKNVTNVLAEKLSPELRKAVLIVGGLLALIGPLMLGFVAIVFIGKAVAITFATIGAAATTASIPVALLLIKFILIAAAVVLVTVAIVLMTEDFLIWRKGGESAIGAILDGFNKLWEEFKKNHPVIAKFVDDWNWGFNQLGQDLHTFMSRDWIPFWEEMVSVAFKANMKYREVMEGIAQATFDFVNEFWGLNPESITDWFINITTWIDRLMKKLEEFNVFDFIVEKIFKVDLSNIKDPSAPLDISRMVPGVTDRAAVAGPLPGLGGGPVVTNENNFNVTVPVTVPTGTLETQKQAISDYTENVTEMLFKKYLGKELRAATQAGSIVE